jgi:hypothetical protein
MHSTSALFALLSYRSKEHEIPREEAIVFHVRQVVDNPNVVPEVGRDKAEFRPYRGFHPWFTDMKQNLLKSRDGKQV